MILSKAWHVVGQKCKSWVRSRAAANYGRSEQGDKCIMQEWSKPVSLQLQGVQGQDGQLQGEKLLSAASICHQLTVHCLPRIWLHVSFPIVTAIANAIFSTCDFGRISGRLYFTFLEDFKYSCMPFLCLSPPGKLPNTSPCKGILILQMEKGFLHFRLSFGSKHKIGEFAPYLAFPTRQPGDEI